MAAVTPGDYYITNGLYPDGTCVFHLWVRIDPLSGVLGIMPYPIATNPDRAVLDKAIEHLCAGPG